MLSLRNRSGFAIPAAILVIGVLSITLAAGFSLVIAERRGVDDQKAQVTAFVLAEQGLQMFFVRRDSLHYLSVPPAAKEGPVRLYMNGGYADVQLDRLRAHPEGCWRIDANVLPDGDRYGARRMCDRDRQYRSVREDDGDRIPRRGPGRSIRDGPRHETGGFRLTI